MDIADIGNTATDFMDRLAGIYDKVQTTKINVRLANAAASEGSFGTAFTAPRFYDWDGATQKGLVGPGVQVPSLLILAGAALLVYLAVK